MCLLLMVHWYMIDVTVCAQLVWEIYGRLLYYMLPYNISKISYDTITILYGEST